MSIYWNWILYSWKWSRCEWSDTPRIRPVPVSDTRMCPTLTRCVHIWLHWMIIGVNVSVSVVLNCGCSHRCVNGCVCCECGYCGCCNAQCGRCGMKWFWNFTNNTKWHYYVTTLFIHHCRVLVYSINTNLNVLKIHGWEIVKTKIFH
jgi:hypothetical protein